MIREILRSVILNKINQRKNRANITPFMDVVRRGL